MPIQNKTTCFLAMLLTTLLAMGCTPYGRGGGRGGRGDDDDDASRDDDDDTSGGNDMVLTMTISNQTGYDWNGYGFNGRADPVTVAPAVTSADALFPTGSTGVETTTIAGVEYGVQFCFAFRARDTDEDCYDWDNHGQCFNTGAQLAIEIIVEFNDWENGGCPAW